MIIRRMTAQFGALDGRTLTLSNGLNVICAPNESGKSTWCAFLCAMLYGMSTAQRARGGVQPERVRYRPWSGAPMAGSVDLITPDGAITLRRWTENAARPMDAFSATFTGTDTPVPGLTAQTAGETLTGMPREVFERTVFIRQLGMRTSNDPALDRRIAAIVSSGDEDVSFIDAEKRLRTWLRARRSGKRGAIPAIQAEIDAAQASLDTIRARRRAVLDADEDIAAMESELASLDKRVSAARAEQRKKALNDLAAARSAVQTAEAARAAASAALTERDNALAASVFGGASYKDAARRAEDDASRSAALLGRARLHRLAYVAVTAFAALGVGLLTRGGAVWSAAAACAFAAAVAAHFAARRSRSRALDERRAILDAYGAAAPEDIEALLESYFELWQARQRAAIRLTMAEEALASATAAQTDTETRTIAALDFTNGDSEAARLSREADRVRAALAARREQRAMAEGQARAIGDAMTIESELAELERRRDVLTRQERALTLALDTLTEADAAMQKILSPRIARAAAEYFSFLTGGRYDELTFTRELTARARPAGDAVGRELDSLSAGTRDQLYLALRLALCDLAVADGGACPLVLDDAFAMFDAERLGRALELTRVTASGRQVLLFTCHEREPDYFRDDPEAHIIAP